VAITILNGDVLTHLRELPEQSVQCCVTSPPYWGLRDYGTGKWDGGNPECDHKPSNIPGPNAACGNTVSLLGRKPYTDICGKCGAKRIDNQIGLEKTPEEYTQKMVEVFREVKRVLRDDGTLWLNLGDSYATAPAGNFSKDMPKPGDGGAYRENKPKMDWRNCGLKPKDLVGIPWRVAFALQADGWYLRSDIIWSKPNPMPESVTDRPTKAHEYMFLLSKKAKYYYDADAVREPHVTQENRPDGIIRNRLFEYDSKENQLRPLKPKKQDLTGNPTYTGFNERWAAKNLQRQDPNSMHVQRANGQGEPELNQSGRNRRTVWEIATQPTPEAHFATFPEALVEPCIKAGSKQGDTILDPFGGSGTTGLVARNLKRDCILIELNPAYVKIMKKKLRLNEQLAV
jgi:DNA modification methylase